MRQLLRPLVADDEAAPTASPQGQINTLARK